MNAFGLSLILGVFFANWLLVPRFFRGKTHKDGFFIGLIVAAMMLAAYCLIGYR